MMAAPGSSSQDSSTMSEIVIPSTPPPQPTHTSNSAEMTPPPSTQPPKTNFTHTRTNSAQRTLFPQSPPSTVKASIELAIPSLQDIANASPDKVRQIAHDVVRTLAETRTSAAHFKLQHTLLTMECQESAQRAEIERQMMVREVEVLKAAEHHRGTAFMSPGCQQPIAQAQIHDLEKTCKALQEEKDEIEHKLHKAKKLVEKEIDRSELLYEENLMLKKRIRENREHFNLMRQSPAFSSLITPSSTFTTPQRKPVPQFADSARSHVSGRNQDPFAALLAADQVLSGEAASMPSTPTKVHATKSGQGHTRGAYSLSSLQTTPMYSRPVIAGESNSQNTAESGHRLAYSAPNTQRSGLSEGKDHHDRDSTISVSDDEVETDEDLPQSQASSLATNMLRRNPGIQDSSRLPEKVEKSSKALQSRLFGQVKKVGADKKRHASFGENEIAKKMKLGEGVGLGIGTWETPKLR
jgi:hypothetical protein